MRVVGTTNGDDYEHHAARNCLAMVQTIPFGCDITVINDVLNKNNRKYIQTDTKLLD